MKLSVAGTNHWEWLHAPQQQPPPAAPPPHEALALGLGGVFFLGGGG